MTDKKEIMVTMSMDTYQYWKENEWKIRAFDRLMSALHKNNSSIVVADNGSMEFFSHSDDWGIHWESAERIR